MGNFMSPTGHYQLVSSTLLMNVSPTFIAWIEKELQLREWKPAVLADRSGITPTQVSRVLNGSRGAGPRFCNGIARAFGMPVSDVLALAGLVDDMPRRGRVREARTVYEVKTDTHWLEVWRNLSADDRRLVLDLMERLRRGVTPRIIGEPAAEEGD